MYLYVSLTYLHVSFAHLGVSFGGQVAVFVVADSRVGLEAFSEAAADAGFDHVRRPFPPHLIRKARTLNPHVARQNTLSLHLLFRKTHQSDSSA